MDKKLTDLEKRILSEILDQNEQTHKRWLKMRMTTDAEREVARMRILVGYELRRKLLGDQR